MALQGSSLFEQRRALLARLSGRPKAQPRPACLFPPLAVSDMTGLAPQMADPDFAAVTAPLPKAKAAAVQPTLVALPMVSGMLPRVTLDAEVKRPRLEQRGRDRAMGVLTDVAETHLIDTQLVKRILAEEGALVPQSVSLDAALTNKSTGTLIKRAGSLRLYRAWFNTSAFDVVDFTSKAAVFAYGRHLLADRAPASRMAALREALNFVEGVFGIDLAGVRRSARVHGLSCKLLRTRAAIRQRAPLTVEMVRALEELLAAEAESGSPHAVVAGAILMCIYGRVRVGDARRCT